MSITAARNALLLGAAIAAGTAGQRPHMAALPNTSYHASRVSAVAPVRVEQQGSRGLLGMAHEAWNNASFSTQVAVDFYKHNPSAAAAANVVATGVAQVIPFPLAEGILRGGLIFLSKDFGQRWAREGRPKLDPNYGAAQRNHYMKLLATSATRPMPSNSSVQPPIVYLKPASELRLPPASTTRATKQPISGEFYSLTHPNHKPSVAELVFRGERAQTAETRRSYLQARHAPA